jgi:preprotein translocase subunit SecE
MAEEKASKKKPRVRKSPETVRERADKQTAKDHAPKGKIKSKIVRPLSVLRKVGNKEYHPVPVPDNKAGKVLKKRVRLMPKFVREAWAELKLVTWSTKKEAARLTAAVLIFATIFAIFVQVLDLIFNRVVKEIFLK